MLMMSGTSAETLSVKMLEGENWWGAANYFGSKMPFTEKSTLNVDLRKRGFANQFASMLISDKGRVVWCEDQTAITITNGTIKMVCGTTAPVLLEKGGNNLKDAFLHAANKWFPSTGRTPDLLFFSAPQYNTWIELTYNQNEKDILAYAQSMLDNGLPPGVLMIDDTWQAGYGDWRFEPTRFKDPKGMMDKLHAQGFKVILWMCPWVSMDIPAFRRIAWGTNPNDVKGYPTKGGFLMDGTKPAAIRWWNGYSALLDLTHPNAQAWFKEQLDGLVRDFGADGFKFDGGAVDNYAQGFGTYDRKASSGDQVLAYAKYCLEYPVCEYRNAWRFQGQPVVERLHDKGHEWSELQKLVPDMIGGGLLGHPFMCPDM
ncbi:MAG: glycoside hydrolase, partial [Kiritimatiellae bacterium]|nr:glycoside hydrolase [Kiritimatiellia bacterium]